MVPLQAFKPFRPSPGWWPYTIVYGFFIALCTLLPGTITGNFRLQSYLEHNFTRGYLNLTGVTIFLYGLMWVLCCQLLILFPKETGARHRTIVLLLSAFICRLTINPDLLDANHFFLILLDAGILIVLLSILEHRRTRLQWIIFYAFNPALIIELQKSDWTITGLIFCLVVALFCFDRKHFVIMFISLGAAIQINVNMVFILPLFIYRKQHLVVGPLIIILLNLPKLFFYRWSVSGFCEAMLVGESCFFVGLFLFLIVIGLFFFHPGRKSIYFNDPVSGSFYVIGISTLFFYTESTWPFVMIIPFLVIRPTLSWFVFAFLIGLMHLLIQSGICKSVSDFEWAASLIMWTPFFILFIGDGYIFAKRFRQKILNKAVESVSVIIPTYNEAEKISACISSIATDPAVAEIIVVDGGSIDKTCPLAQKAGAKVIINDVGIEQGGGRGGQIAIGLKHACGDVIAVVHADAYFLEPVFTQMVEILELQPLIVGGAVGSVFDEYGWRFRILEWLNDFRMIFFNLGFGDQIQFFRRHPVVENDLYPNIPLMEDVELSLRLRHLGRQIYFFGSVRISGRRWKKKGFKNSILVIRLVFAYLIKRLWKVPNAVDIYHKYYGVGDKFR